MGKLPSQRGWTQQVLHFSYSLVWNMPESNCVRIHNRVKPAHIPGAPQGLAHTGDVEGIVWTPQYKSSLAWQGERLVDVGHHKPIQSSVWEIWAHVSVFWLSWWLSCLGGWSSCALRCPFYGLLFRLCLRKPGPERCPFWLDCFFRHDSCILS